MKPLNEGFVPPHGGYRKLLSFQKSEIIFFGTDYFCDRFLKPGDRTIDQMKQAARSGKQNICEGSMASATSKQTEIILTNVAKSSLEELELDYEDFLKKRKLSIWEKDHKLVKRLRELNRTPGANYETFKKAIEHPNPEICANTMITLIRIAIYLLGRQINALEKEFLKEGGIKERMLKARLNQKNKIL